MHVWIETQRPHTAPTYGTSDSKATNSTAAEQAGAAATRNESLYNPILRAEPAENTSSVRRATAISIDSRNLGKEKSPLVQGGVGEREERGSGSGTGQENGITYSESKYSFFRR